MSPGSPNLQDRDGPDFERVLRQAMGSERVRTALARSPGGAEAARLRSEARAAADRIAAAAAEEYAAYARARSGRGPRRRRSLLPALAVLAPAVAAGAAVILLLLGSLLELGGAQPGLAGPLVSAGWVCALVAGAAVAAGVLGMFVTAARNRAPERRGRRPAGVERAREEWRTALLERGMLPFLEGLLEESAPAARDGQEG